MKELKDYLPLYLGCQIIVCDLDGQTFFDRIESVINDKAGQRFSIYEFGDIEYDTIEEYCQWVKPILRPLSDITEKDFYSFNQPETENDILITATINKRWCAGWYDKKEYDERVEEGLCTDAEDLLYDLEDADHENVICCDKNGTISHGLNDDYCYFVDLPTQSNWINHLRKRGFDCDRLIESGLAINKTTLTQQTK
jgi:hypothetical protein